MCRTGDERFGKPTVGLNKKSKKEGGENLAYQTIIVEKKDGVAKITLNRPDRMNAINPTLATELRDAMEEIKKDDSVKVVVITGAPRIREKEGKTEIRYVFSAGWDMSEAAPLPFSLTDYIQDYEKPVIAMVNGYALGGGNELALACDFIFASENSELGQPEVLRGFLPGWGGTQRLPRRIGLPKAKMLILTGKTVSGKEAERLGMVDVCVPMEKLEETVMEFAKDLAKKAPLAVKKIKEVMNKGIEMDLKSALKLEEEALNFLTQTEDFQEGLMAFLEKREPQWKGR
ncbi:MAG: enoyl-CoA hydratase/isomerase family protein [Candidatus Hadarchaeales archaeon]